MANTQQWEEYVISHPYLYPLRFTADQAKKQVAAKRRLAITQVQKNDTVYLNLRHFDFFTYEWYDKIGFPDKTLCYFIPIRIGDWVAARSKLKVYAYLITHGNKKIIPG